nr:glycosyltransferase [Kovacikia minuta]
MKVLHVIPSISPLRGGPSQAAIEMVGALRTHGVEAEIVTTNDHGPDLLDVPLNQRIEYQHVPVRFFSRFSPSMHAAREFAFSHQLTTWLWHQVRNYDLLHVHAIFSYPSTIAMAIARQKQVPYINRPLGQLCEWSLQQSARKKQTYLQLIERSNLNQSTALHFTSHQEHQETKRLGLKTPGVVLPHGLTLAPAIPNARQRLRQQFNLPADEPIILFLSRLHPKKGLDYLIPALGKLRHYRFTFILAGNGSPEYETEVEALLRQYELSDRTCRAGFVTGEKKDLLLQGSDLFALTSHSENFGVAVLEAMAVGLPVIVTPGIALAAVVAEHQLGLVPRLNAEAISFAIDHCLSHPEQRREMGDRARQLVLAKYTWKQVTAQMQQTYAAIRQQKPLPVFD